PGVVVQLLLNFFGNLWATVVGNSTGNFWTLIVLVKYAVTIGIRPRASVVFRRTGLTWALIVLVGNTVTVSIGTSGQSGSSGFVWTGIILIGNTVTIGIRASVHFFGTGL